MIDPSTLFSVAGKTVLVTGGTRGIGFAIAEGFVRSGARVIVCGRNADAAAEAQAELSAHGDVTGLPADLGTDEGRSALVRHLEEETDGLDVLVNNAGTIWAEKIEDYPESGWDKVFDLNVKGTFFAVQALLPLLQKRATQDDPSRIINIGSIDGFHIPSHETYAYSSSKAAVHHLTRHLAWRLASDHITVNVLAPGMFASKMLQGTLEQKGAETMLEPVPMKRFANPVDMAGTAIYLASPAASYVTGAVLPVDGGTATTV